MKNFSIFKTLQERSGNSLISLNQLEIILAILIKYNCRISEVLSARWDLFTPGLFLILEGKKRSANVIIRDTILLNSINKLVRNHPTKIFAYISYFTVYHYIKSKYSHLLKNIKTKKNKKITHAFRYLNVYHIDNDKFIKDILHHNSTKSGKYYKNKIKE